MRNCLNGGKSSIDRKATRSGKKRVHRGMRIQKWKEVNHGGIVYVCAFCFGIEMETHFNG